MEFVEADVAQEAPLKPIAERSVHDEAWPTRASKRFPAELVRRPEEIDHSTMSSRAGLTWMADATRSARRLGAGLWAGLLSGAVLGGIGGRLAMFVLRLTSDPRVVGMTTDDGFVIGSFTADTGFLVLVTTALGGLGGIFYLAVRPWLPARSRPVIMGILGAMLGGAAVIHPDGIDFRVLEPLWLAVAMFIALPGLYGMMMSVLAERFLARAEHPQRFIGWLPAFLPLAGLLIAGPFGLGLAAVVAIGWTLNRVLPLVALWDSSAVTWLGRVALLAVGVLSLRTLVEALAETTWGTFPCGTRDHPGDAVDCRPAMSPTSRRASVRLALPLLVNHRYQTAPGLRRSAAVPTAAHLRGSVRAPVRGPEVSRGHRGLG
jgi:hypothetical protein